MKTKLVLTLLVGVIIGLAVPVLHRQAQAQPTLPPPQEKEKWEYKVEWFGSTSSEKPAEAAARFTKEFNEFSNDGWEFVSSTRINMASAQNGEFILFERTKK